MKEILNFLEERAYELYSLASDEAEMLKRDKPKHFTNADEREAYTKEVSRLFSKSYEFLDLADRYSFMARRFTY